MNPAMAALWHGDDSSKDIATVGAHQRGDALRLFFSEGDNALYPCRFCREDWRGGVEVCRGLDQTRKAFYLHRRRKWAWEWEWDHAVDMDR
jgi:hypothetical protein